MPEYSFRCSDPDCAASFSRVLAIVNRNAPQDCPECGEPAEKQVSPGVGGVLRGDVWPGKNMTVKRQMAERRARVGEREYQLKMDGPQVRLTPNVDGEQVDSWSDAARLAASKGKDPSGYERKARLEKNRGKRGSA